jgi:hypothetical protein
MENDSLSRREINKEETASLPFHYRWLRDWEYV